MVPFCDGLVAHSRSNGSQLCGLSIITSALEFAICGPYSLCLSVSVRKISQALSSVYRVCWNDGHKMNRKAATLHYFYHDSTEALECLQE